MEVFNFVALYVTILHSSFASETKQLQQSQPEKPTKKYTALIFNEITHQLEELKKEGGNNSSKQCHYCLTACPADSVPEKTFSHLDALTMDSLFLRRIYLNKNKSYVKDIQIDICNAPFKPGMVYNDTKKNYNIGYELYVDDKMTNLYTEKYDDLRKIIYHHVQKSPLSHSPLVQKSTDKENKITKFSIGSDEEKTLRRLVFFWIPVLSIQFVDYEKHNKEDENPIKYHQRHIKFKRDAINDYQTIDNCDDHVIGDEFLKKQMEKLVRESSLPQLTKGHSNSICNDNCLEKTQIVPMSFFHTRAAKLATCEHMNFAFVWEKIARGQLKKVDRYLYAVLRHWYSSVNIIFGMSSPLDDLDRSRESEEPLGYNEGDENFRKIPTPKILYRIVEYFLMNRIYQVLIIIHNDPNVNPDQDRICSKQSEVSGWDRISNSNDLGTGLSYACQLIPETVNKLGIYGGSTPSKLIEIFETLRLDKFPHYEKPALWSLSYPKFFYENEIDNVENEYRTIFKDEQ